MHDVHEGALERNQIARKRAEGRLISELERSL